LDNWFRAKNISLNLKKTYFIQFTAKTKIQDGIIVNHNNKFINNAFSTKFLGIMIDSALTWKNHIDLLVGKLI
jgi:hypothetical protein